MDMTKLKTVARAGGLGIIAVGTVQIAVSLVGSMALVASWASSAALIAVLGSTPGARPKAVFGGHVIAALVGIGAALVSAEAAWMVAASVGIVIMLMVLLDIFHPPAAANAAIPFLGVPSLPDYFVSVLIGGALLALFSYFLNRKPA